VITAYGSIRSAVDSIHAGAADYLTKPFEPEELQIAVHSAVKLHDLISENRQLQAAISGAGRHRRLIGESPAMQALLERAWKARLYSIISVT
jgi:DNA-binding NtrC family response regulator